MKKIIKENRRPSKGKTVVEYLPDADEIERSPISGFARNTLHILVLSIVMFLIWDA
jgi:HlyD family secretion protein